MAHLANCNTSVKGFKLNPSMFLDKEYSNSSHIQFSQPGVKSHGISVFITKKPANFKEKNSLSNLQVLHPAVPPPPGYTCANGVTNMTDCDVFHVVSEHALIWASKPVLFHGNPVWVTNTVAGLCDILDPKVSCMSAAFGNVTWRFQNKIYHDPGEY